MDPTNQPPAPQPDYSFITDQPDKSSPAVKPTSDKKMIFAGVLLLAVVAIFIGLMVYKSLPKQAAGTVTGSDSLRVVPKLFEAANSGDADAGYSYLTPSKQRDVTQDDFKTLVMEPIKTNYVANSCEFKLNTDIEQRSAVYADCTLVATNKKIRTEFLVVLIGSEAKIADYRIVGDIK